jgi:gliding motility-associated lipoprotein GldH
MRFLLLIVLFVVLLGCDSNRVFEDNKDFPRRSWSVSDTASFEFEIKDASVQYNVACDIRNDLDYPWARIFVTYILEDSTHQLLATKLVGTYLFEGKTGEPLGSSGLGDIYDHRFPLLEKHTFTPGKYFIKLRQEMRTDTLKGILAAGVRVEKVEAK